MRKAALIGGAVLLALASASAPAAAQPAISLNYVTYTLENGLKVILVEDHSAPVVAVDVWYHVGSANDPVNRSGFAHLFEHMMFQGTANTTKEELLRLVDDAGGSYNAYTAVDRTAFHETLPAHQLPLGLWLEADRMSSLAVTQTNLDNQRSVVIQEFEQSYGNVPYGLGLKDLYSLPYSYEPYQRSTIGSVEDLNQATVAEITAFHSTYYVPNNATLTVAGDFDEATVRQYIDQYFGAIPGGPAPPPLPEWVPGGAAAVKDDVTIPDGLVRIPGVFIGYEIPTPRDPDFAPLEVLASILGTGNSSRLSRDLIDSGDALVAQAGIETNNGPSLFTTLLLPGSMTRDDLEAAYVSEIQDIVDNGVTQDEIDKAVALARSGRLAGLETDLGIAEEVQSGNALYGDPDAVVQELADLAAVTPADVQRVAAQYLNPEVSHVFRVDQGPPQPFVEPVPYVGATGTPADDAYEVNYALPYADPPEPLPVTSLDFPPMTVETLPNGLEVVVVETPELPVLSLDLVFKGGARAVPGGEAPAVSDIEAYLMTRGTTTRSAQDIASTIESHGGVTGSYSQNDLTGFGIFALIEDRALAFDLLEDMTLNPTFPDDELNVQLGQLQGGLEAGLSDPDAQVGRAFYPAVYGGHPYGDITTLDDVGTITHDQIVAYYDSIARPDNALLIIAGRITAEEGLELARSHFSDWTADGPAPTFTTPTQTPAAGDTILVNVPGAQQAQVMIGNLAINGESPDRYALSVVNAVLGSGLSSRLNQVLREEKGYSYGVSSGLSLPVDTGVFAVSTSVEASSVVDAVQEIRDQVHTIRTEAIGDEELSRVRGGMIGRFALNLETYQDFVDTISSYWVRGLPLDAISDYPELIAAVTPATGLAAAQEYLPENLVTVVAGDAAVLGPPLEAAGPVTVVDPQ